MVACYTLDVYQHHIQGKKHAKVPWWILWIQKYYIISISVVSEYVYKNSRSWRSNVFDVTWISHDHLLLTGSAISYEALKELLHKDIVAEGTGFELGISPGMKDFNDMDGPIIGESDNLYMHPFTFNRSDN